MIISCQIFITIQEVTVRNDIDIVRNDIDIV